MDKIIPLRVDEITAEQVDRLVVRGIFRSRNDGIRAGIREILRKYEKSRTEKRIAIARVVANHVKTTHQDIIDSIYLFGSVSKGTDEPESDTDILVITRNALVYDQELAIISEVGRLLRGVDEYVSVQFECVDDFMVGSQQGFEFESTIRRHGMHLAGSTSEDPEGK